jgi:Domain of unknown function (DUF4129)
MQEQRAWRSVLAIGGLLALLAVVAVAAAGHAPAGGASKPSASTPNLVKDYIGTIALLMLPIGAFLVLWSAFLRRAYKDVPLKTSPLYPGMMIPKPIAWLILLAIVLAIGVRYGRPDPNRQGQAPPAAGGTKTKLKPGTPEYEPQFRWVPIFAVGSMVVGLGGFMAYLALRRRRGEDEEGAPVRETLAEVLSETLDDLMRESDPRKAVIGAYVKMERTLAARGFPRRESEAPIEYLRRILGIVGGSGHSARRLTRLFERARFSPHEIDQRMKDDAIESLIGLRAELEAAPT